MRNFDRLLVISAVFLLGITVAGHGQNLGASLPGSATLFRPQSDVVPDEATTYTGLPFFTGLPFRVSVYGNIGYDDNVFDTHSDRQGSGFNSLGLNIGSHIANPRTRLDALLSAGFIAYWNRSSHPIAPDISLNLDFTHQLSPRAVIGISSFMTYQDQPDVVLGLNQANNVSNYFYSWNTIAFGYQWTRRFSTVTSYSLGTLFYDESTAAHDDDWLQHVFAQQFRFMVLPMVNAVAEYRFGIVDYLYLDNDSYSHYVLGGLDATLSPRLEFGFRAGAEFRHLDGPAGGDVSYPYLESTLAYKYQPGSRLLWYNRYGLEQPDLAGPGYRKTYRTGIRVDHRFGEKLRGTAAAYYSWNEYHVATAFTEDIVDLSLQASYQLTRAFSLDAGYIFTRDFSDITSRDYYRNRVYVGGTFSF
jgi:hypothetical protein